MTLEYLNEGLVFPQRVPESRTTLRDIFDFTIPSGFMNHWATGRRPMRYTSRQV